MPHNLHFNDPPPDRRNSTVGFTLIEMLLVIGIVALLIGILLPVLSSAQRAARDVKCKSNLRQTSAALLNYAGENKGRFPPNIDNLDPRPASGSTWNYWCDAERIGRYLPNTGVAQTSNFLQLRDGVICRILVCPEDDGSSRSYSMNFWASSAVNTWNGRVEAPNIPRAGQAWGPHSKDSARLVLLFESFSCFSDGLGSFAARQVAGSIGVITDPRTIPLLSPGKRFVGDLKILFMGPVELVRYFPAQTEIDWARHRSRGNRGFQYADARGRANFAFADGHVASHSPEDLAHRGTTKSTFTALWSPYDYTLQRMVRP